MVRFWVRLIMAVVVVLLIGAGSLIWVALSVSSERVTPVTTLNPEGSAGQALLVYHPGLSDFPDRIVGAFSDGLVQSGWRIDRTTASKQAPADLAGYDLVVLASPLYGGLARPMADYIARVGDFVGKPVAIILTGAGDTEATLAVTRDLVATAHGRVVAGLAYTTMRPNQSAKAYPGSNTDKAIAMALDAGMAMALPGT
jgi:hypothetical protein